MSPIRTGDAVKHGPTGEEWLVAYADHERGELAPCGWPPCIAKLADCLLVESCTDAEHTELVERLRNMQGDHGESDHRAVAIRRLYPVAQQPTDGGDGDAQ